jgi:1-acyl-sn-glycerol-3-phosphate acyltransferase
MNRATRVIYGAWAWLALLLAALPVAVGLAVVPGTLARRRIARRGAKAFFALIGARVRTSGGSVPATDCVVVANHASYLDGIILTAALPPRFTFLIKHEMASFPLAGFVLRRLGSEFVNRDDAVHRNRMARRLLDAAQRGKALAFFPEGTFDSEPGLKEFAPGAFRAAWRARLPVVPVVITGARDKLPAGRFFAAPGPLGVHVSEPLHAADFDSPRALTQAARRAMLSELGEADLTETNEDSQCGSALPDPKI